MPTSSQSKILSVVDYQLLQQQKQTNEQDQSTITTIRRLSVHSPDNQIKRRQSIGKKDTDDNKQLSSLPNLNVRRRHSMKINDSKMKFFLKKEIFIIFSSKK